MNAGGNSSNRADSKESPTYSWFIPLVGEAKSSSDTVPTRCNHKNIYHQKKEEGDDDKENNVILHKKDDLRSCILQRFVD